LIGAVFAPRPELVAAELKRVCPAGRYDRHGELDAWRICGADVPDDF